MYFHTFSRTQSDEKSPSSIEGESSIGHSDEEGGAERPSPKPSNLIERALYRVLPAHPREPFVAAASATVLVAWGKWKEVD